MKKNQRFILNLLLAGSFVFPLQVIAQKTVHVPSTFADPNNPSSHWSYERSKESDNWIVFWESGFGTDPNDDPDPELRVDVDNLLEVAEKSFIMNRDSLKFVIKGSSKSDDYKMIALLKYTKDWIANGAGVDSKIGLFTVSARATREQTMAHEIGHCFQYQAGADQYPLDPGAPEVGYKYGLGPNGEGGNGWWEQCAQWQAFKVFPEKQFDDIGSFTNSAHLHILHEEPRYKKYYIHDYWIYLHGWDFIGRLWRESYFPEDPVDTYKRIIGIDQKQFNNEMYRRAARLTTFDIPHIKERGKDYIASWGTNPLTSTGDGAWKIGSAKCIQNYGFNVVRLNAPASASQVKVCFEGKAGAEGYRAINIQEAGWRYGFVALLKTGKRVYSPMGISNYNKKTRSNPLDTLSFDVPENCEKLWFVVSGSPQKHWHHQWDDKDSNDEQWPYQVKFENTNPYGDFEFEPGEVAYSDTLSQIVTMFPVTANEYPVTPTQPDIEKICRAFKLSVNEIEAAMGSSIKYCAVNPDGAFDYQSTANAPGHWFDENGNTVTYSNANSHIFSEFRIGNFAFNIGQYPNRCEAGDEFTIKQALVYTPQGKDPVHVMCVFDIKILSSDDKDGDTYTNENDNCPNTYNQDQLDSDGDGVGDACDQCIGYADTTDTDNDGVGDNCDVCDGYEDEKDTDSDGIPDGCDVCPSGSDIVDSDGDGVFDGCDICEGFNDTVDTDKDGIPDGCDLCDGANDSIDNDSDAIPDDCDICTGYDDFIDTDMDAVPNGCDICEGSDDSIDTDSDGTPDGCDVCDGEDDSVDTDEDDVPDGCDICEGFDDAVDTDNDGIPDGCDTSNVSVDPSSLTRVLLSPNPVEDILNINWSSANLQNLSVRIYDINGRLLCYKESIEDQSTYISFKDWNKGIYFVHIFDNNKRIVHKILKK